MTNKKSTKRALLTSVMALLLSFSMLLGTTLAWFTDSVTSGNNIIKPGNLDITLEYWNGTKWVDVAGRSDILTNELWEPGVTEIAYLRVANAGSLALKYQLGINILNELAGKNQKGETFLLSDYLLFGVVEGVNGESAPYSTDDAGRAAAIAAVTDAKKISAGYTKAATMQAGEPALYFALVVYMPTDTDDKANHNGTDIPQIDLGINVVATQMASESDSFNNQYDANAKKPADTWDGMADTSWYDPANPLTEYKLGTAEQLAGLSELVAGNTTFAGVTITLTNDIDLYCEDTTPAADGDPLTFRPIGDHSKGGTFEGVFDGNGKTISNIYQNGWDLGYQWGAYGSYGLFGNLNNATVKNLTLSGGESYIEGGDVSFVAGSATGTCVFENITIEDSIAATYNNGCGGIIGWSGAGNYTFKDITIAEDVVLGGLWGSFDSSIGGIVGQAEPGATYTLENVDIACRIDAYNDCTASYDYYNYRMCGMLIGRLEETTTIDGSNYPDTSKYNITCTNVKVTYGEWADYHYCRAAGARAKRVEAGYSYGGIADDYDHSVCSVHHMECIAFDQIFGGAQYAVKGLTAYNGVEVIYNNDKN